ncbi:hypothetical protein E2C01_090179 [Portunus trituberculatus]|uniref:Uncharacterized protein n=1 Tax=Portunus trituberculatus TaxID=210409 RepID=A0A5B7JPE8_PORTR|nr:hypothetical protein [Portunus trituberculatus]
MARWKSTAAAQEGEGAARGERDARREGEEKRVSGRPSQFRERGGRRTTQETSQVVHFFPLVTTNFNATPATPTLAAAAAAAAATAAAVPHAAPPILL